ncbi:MAG: hypothetical protein ACRDNZ_10030 [Streptosporangiaceae bacterium]
MTDTPMTRGRRADSARRRQRVIKAINDAGASGGELSVSAIARAAAVDRTFLYRHPDLLAQAHLAQERPTAAENGGPAASRASLQADLANAQGQVARQAVRVRQLEAKLSQMLGEQAWRECGLGTPRTSTRSGGGSPSLSRPWSSSTASCRNAKRSSTPPTQPTAR